MPRAPPAAHCRHPRPEFRAKRHLIWVPIEAKEPWYRVIQTRCLGSLSFADPVGAGRRSSGLRPKETQLVSTPSVAPVATGTTGVSYTDPVTRFQQAVDIQLQVNDLERRVQRLMRQLTPRSPSSHWRSSRRSLWWPTV
jgi:hypothetical protein